MHDNFPALIEHFTFNFNNPDIAYPRMIKAPFPPGIPSQSFALFHLKFTLTKYNRLSAIRHHNSLKFFSEWHQTELSGVKPDVLS